MPHTTYDHRRVLNFTDAVFSIALALLILEVNIPSAEAFHQTSFWDIIASIQLELIGFIVSFFVIALYWVAHLRISKYVEEIDHPLLWRHILLLFFVVLLPFSTAFYVTGFATASPFMLYCTSLAMIGLLHLLILKKVTSQSTMEELTVKYEMTRAYVALAVFVFTGLLSMALPFWSRSRFALVFILQPIFTKRLKRKKESERKNEKQKKKEKQKRSKK